MLVDPAFGLHSLGALARSLSVSTALHPLLETAAEEALLALRAASVSISRLEQGGRLIRVIVNVGDLAPTEVRWPEDETYLIDHSGVGRKVLSDGITQTAWLGNSDCDPKEAELLKALGKESSVAAAILVDGSVWGEFYATRHPSKAPFAETAEDYVDVFTAIVGAAISRSVRETELAYLAFHDGLTGALNRRGLDEAAAHLFDLIDEPSRVVTTVALDINGLKQVNDQHGHPRGDELIEAVARSLDRAFASYPGSLVARVGGDEFTVLVPDHDPHLVATTVQALCRRRGQDWGVGPVAGISAGVSSTYLTGRGDATRVDLLAAADRALYLAKQHPLSTAVVSEELTAVGKRAPGRAVERAAPATP